MKKKAVSLLMVAAMMTTMAAGCGNKAANNAGSDAAADNSTTSDAAAEETAGTEAAAADSEDEPWSGTITVWSPQEDQDTGWLAKECDAFNAAHPNWDITFNYGVCAEGDAKATVNSIVIENDGAFEEVSYTPCEDVTALSKEEIIGKVKEAGVVGMGGAGFPTHVKLSPKEPEKIEYIIANCAECEPYLTADYRRMLENPEELIGGMKIILQIFDKAKGVFGIENNKPDCIEKLQELVKDEPRIEVCPLETKYPQGGERQLIYAVTGRSINSKMLPADAGCIVDNVETIIAIYNAVKLGKPVTNRISTITGDAVEHPGNFLYNI